MINLEVSNYIPPYNFLNSVRQANATILDLSRCILTVGRENWNDVFAQGIYRIIELACKGLAYAEMDNGNLILNELFYTLTQSEKAVVSYHFGQGLTKLYSENFLNVIWLYHLDNYSNITNYVVRGRATSKIIVGNTTKHAAWPDLVGIENSTTIHILEAKGNSGGYDKSVMQHAINQVSQVITYNHISPSTRSACYFDLSKTPIKGIIIDPPENVNGIQIENDLLKVLTLYYLFFRENANEFNYNINLGKFIFKCLPIIKPNLFLGFDERILKLSNEEILINGLYSKNEITELKQNKPFEFSLGLDGLILIDDTSSPPSKAMQHIILNLKKWM